MCVKLRLTWLWDWNRNNNATHCLMERSLTTETNRGKGSHSPTRHARPLTHSLIHDQMPLAAMACTCCFCMFLQAVPARKLLHARAQPPCIAVLACAAHGCGLQVYTLPGVQKSVTSAGATLVMLMAWPLPWLEVERRTHANLLCTNAPSTSEDQPAAREHMAPEHNPLNATPRRPPQPLTWASGVVKHMAGRCCLGALGSM